MVEKDKVRVYGNTAVKTERREIEVGDNEREKKLRKLKIKNLRKNLLRKKIKVVGKIACIFLIGAIVIGGYSLTYNLQAKLNNLEDQVDVLKKNNENLKVEKLKHGGIEKLEAKATGNLKMVMPQREKAITLDLSKNNFKTKEEVNKNKSFLNKLKEFLF